MERNSGKKKIKENLRRNELKLLRSSLGVANLGNTSTLEEYAGRKSLL